MFLSWLKRNVHDNLRILVEGILLNIVKFSIQNKVPELKRSLSLNRGVPMASRRGQILLAIVCSIHVLPVRLAIVSTQVPFQLKRFALYRKNMRF